MKEDKADPHGIRNLKMNPSFKLTLKGEILDSELLA